jgi:transcriptional regulator with XRE-family HTH domain
MKTVIKYGPRIKQLREDKGWTQEHLESVAGVAVRTIQRVESDQTKNPETLAAIAAAFDVVVGDLGQKFRVAESKPPKALLIESAADFGMAMQRAHHEFAIRRLTKTTERAEEIVQSITEDLQYISPDEPELFNSFLQSLIGPLEELHSEGLGLFSIQESFDRFLRFNPDEQAIPFEGWTRGHFIIVPRFGCFRIGGQASREKLHRFSAACPEAITQILKMFQEEIEVGIFATALAVLAPKPGGSEPVVWCDSCFPVQADGSRLTMGYLATVLGRTETELERLISQQLEDFPIIGHA